MIGIKGMTELPSCCKHCPCSDGTQCNLTTEYNEFKGRPNNCPLVEDKVKDVLMEYIESMCHEVLNLKSFYEEYKSSTIKCCHDLETGSTFWVDGIGSKAEQMNKYYNQYTQGYRELSILCHKLGGEYLKLFESILKEENN